jgi:UDP-N-acetylmuramyl pentapeptide phosphotransferase/UDP-N-acetylglucosamine-1-phosphate transferase
MGEAFLLAGVGLATGLVTGAATGALIPILRRRKLLDHPNERSSHSVPTPRGGGVALVGSVVLAWLGLAGGGWVPPEVAGISFGAGLLGAVSWIDDLRGLSPLLRLFAQGAAVAAGMCVLPGSHSGLEAWPGSAFLLGGIGLLWVWWINLFNFMDGIDGLAASEAAAIGVGVLLFTTLGIGADPASAAPSAAVVGAAIGFLVWNWSPARIFLGDVGSVPLGYLLGFLLLQLALRGFWKVALIVSLYFWADATMTLMRRVLRGERVWQAHREHYYQQATQAGLGHAAVVKRVITANVLLIGCAWAAENGWGALSLAASVAIVAALLVALSLSRRSIRRSRQSAIGYDDDIQSAPDPMRPYLRQ